MASQRKNAVLVSVFLPHLLLELSPASFSQLGGGDVAQALCGLASRSLSFLLLQVTVMVAAAGSSFTASVFISAYSCLTFTYGEEDEDVFHHHSSAKVVTTLNATCTNLVLS